MIVKVQTALYPLGAPALIYSRDRSVFEQRLLSDREAIKMRGDVKAYFEADHARGRLELKERVPDQDW